MFFLLAVLSMIGYSVQNTLLAHHSRNLDGFSTTLYRNVSLVFTAMPLLLFVDWQNLNDISHFFVPIFWAGVFGALGMICGLEATNHLPIGISKAFGRVFRILMMGVLGYVFFGEILTFWQIAIMGGMMVGAVGLSLHTNDFEHLAGAHIKQGFLFSFLAPIFGASSVVAITFASRGSDPFLVGYLWEASIACVLVLWALIRYFWNGYIPRYLSWRTFKKVGIDSSPTVIGTGCYIWATTMGPVGILGAIGSSSILFVTLLGWVLYHEKLRNIDLVWMGMIVLGVLLLQLV